MMLEVTSGAQILAIDRGVNDERELASDCTLDWSACRRFRDGLALDWAFPCRAPRQAPIFRKEFRKLLKAFPMMTRLRLLLLRRWFFRKRQKMIFLPLLRSVILRFAPDLPLASMILQAWIWLRRWIFLWRHVQNHCGSGM
jgi:hypothetical protein